MDLQMRGIEERLHKDKRERSVRKRRGGKKQGRRGRQLWQVVTVRLMATAAAAVVRMV
jgi:hypothetical protein